MPIDQAPVTLTPHLATNYINCCSAIAHCSDTIVVVDPSTDDDLGSIPAGCREDVSQAVASARAALASWSTMNLQQRARILGEAAARAIAAADELAELQCREMGQPWAVCRPLTEQVLGAIAAAGQAALDYPFVTIISGDSNTLDFTEVRRVPFGVGGLITPWNFPIPVAIEGLSVLLAAGNTVVWKPSERAPFSARRLAELLDLPPGVLNLVHGDSRAGIELADHDEVDIVVFTGGEQAGLSVAAASASRCRPVLLELGGNDPVIVDSDVDPVWAAQVVAHGAFWNSGQVCASMERIYVHQDLADEFVNELVRLAEGLNVGPALNAATQLGPLASATHRDSVHRQVTDATDKGAVILTGGAPLLGAGNFYPPTVLTGLNDDMLIMGEETFGPIAPVTVIKTFEEGLRLAKRGRFGLGATVLSSSRDHGDRGREIPAAICWVNEWQGGAPGMTYAPTKSSGIGTVGSFDSVTRPVVLHSARPGAQPAYAG